MKESDKLTKLIAGCLRKDASKQMELYRHFFSYAMGICLRYSRTRESALEMVNDGFLKVFVKIAQYDEQYEFKPWFRKILVNAAIDHYRKYDKKESAQERGRGIVEVTSYNMALDQLEFDDLLEVMKKLPPTYRLVFNLYVIEGLAHADIAERLSISIGSSKSNLSRARQKIKELLVESHGIHLKI